MPPDDSAVRGAVPGDSAGRRRVPLNRERVLRAAVALADEVGIAAVSMRRLAQQLGVVPMALYKHVADKDELLDGMVDVVISEFDPPDPALRGKDGVRQRVLSARRAVLRGLADSEGQVLRAARVMLVAEVAVSLGVDEHEAQRLVDAHLP